MQNLYIFNVTVYQNGAEGEELSRTVWTTHKSVNHTRLKGVVYDFPCLVATWHRNRYYLALGGRMSYGAFAGGVTTSNTPPRIKNEIATTVKYVVKCSRRATDHTNLFRRGRQSVI